MIVMSSEVKSLEGILEATYDGRYEDAAGLAQKAFLAFFLDHPHLLLATHFDEFRDLGVAHYLRFLWQSDFDDYRRQRPKSFGPFQIADLTETVMRHFISDQYL